MEPASETTPLLKETTTSTISALEKLGNRIENTEETCMDKTFCLRDWCDHLGLSLSIALTLSGTITVIGTLLAAYFLPQIDPRANKIFFLFGAGMAISGLIGTSTQVLRHRPVTESPSLQSV